MTVKEFNNLIELFEMDMLKMTPKNRFNVLVDLTRDRHRLAGRTYNATELMVLLEQLSESYVHLALCRAICNILYIYE